MARGIEVLGAHEILNTRVLGTASSDSQKIIQLLLDKDPHN